MQLLPKTRGQVSWSGNPLDDPISVLESMGRPATTGRPGSPLPQSHEPNRHNSDFMPFADSEPGVDHDIFQTPDRAIRLGASPAGVRRHPPLPRQPGTVQPTRSDPQALRSAWANWYAAHPVPHGHARAAASLRIKEPELLRALDGHGVHLLRNDLADLLAPAAQWGRLLAEVHHPLGFAFVSLSPRQVRSDDGQVALLEPDRQLLLGASAFADWFVVHGAGALGLHGFDDRGEPIARLHLATSASALTHSIAMQHLKAHALAAGQAASVSTRTVGSRLTRPGWCAIERQIHAPDALADMCRVLNLTLDAAPAMQFALESEAAILACQATPVHKAPAHATVPHALRDCKVHLRAAALRHATVCTGSDGRPFVRLHAQDGHCLRFQHGGSHAQAQAWVASLLSGRA